MTATLLHISDPHFGDTNSVLTRHEVECVLRNLLNEAGQDVLVVVSGDISFRGQEQGYSQASDALRQVFGGVSKKRIIVCPGNHDMVKSASGASRFEAFDRWSAALRNDKHCTFSTQSCRHVEFDNASFLVINSAYHGDIKYGLVNLQEMDAALADITKMPAQDRPRIAVLHHNLIPFSGRADESTTRNAYQVLTRLIEHGFLLTLHGHQHASLELGVGGGGGLMKICGVSSFRYLTPGFVNGASIYRINDANQVSVQRYAISKDSQNLLQAFTNF